MRSTHSVKTKIFILIAVIIVFALCFNCQMPTSSSSGGSSGKKDSATSDITRVYAGSDPKGDFIEIRIDETNHLVTEINHTLGSTRGPYEYSKVPQGQESFGFDFIYRAEINEDGVAYALFGEFKDTAVFYQLFNADDKTVGNPVYALLREMQSNSDLYEMAGNWMNFKISYDPDDSNMSCGFGGYDSDPGLLYGAGYSHKDAIKHGDNGVNNINNNSTLIRVVDLGIDNDTISRYINIKGGFGMGDRISFIGTPSGAMITDFGPDIGGGSGLSVPQAQNHSWNSNYQGTYFTMSYENKPGQSTIEPLKIVLTDGIGDSGYIEVYTLEKNTNKYYWEKVFESNATPLRDYITPDGDRPIDMLSDAAGNSSAVSSVIQNAHFCNGSFIVDKKIDDEHFIIFLILHPDGTIGGFTGYSEKNGIHTYRFGFMLKDPNYSNAGM